MTKGAGRHHPGLCVRHPGTLIRVIWSPGPTLVPSPTVSRSDFLISGNLLPDQEPLGLTLVPPTADPASARALNALSEGALGWAYSVESSWQVAEVAGVSSVNRALSPPQGHSKSIQCLTVHKNGGKSYIYSGSHDGHINIL